MTYAFLLYPHANIRYRQSLLQLAVQELSMTLSALGREAEVVPQKMGGAMFLTFEAAKLTERDMRMLSQLASVYMLFEMVYWMRNPTTYRLSVGGTFFPVKT